MARWENENVDNLDLPSPEKITYKFFGEKGEEADESSAFAKVADNSGFKTYYIKYGRGDLLDPFGADKNKHNRPYFDFKRVPEKVYDYYMEYITSTDRIFLTRARRIMMEV